MGLYHLFYLQLKQRWTYPRININMNLFPQTIFSCEKVTVDTRSPNGKWRSGAPASDCGRVAYSSLSTAMCFRQQEGQNAGTLISERRHGWSFALSQHEQHIIYSCSHTSSSHSCSVTIKTFRRRTVQNCFKTWWLFHSWQLGQQRLLLSTLIYKWFKHSWKWIQIEIFYTLISIARHIKLEDFFGWEMCFSCFVEPV